MDSNRGITINTEKEIYDYIKSNETNGALLIKGNWGSGKTFLINSIIEKEKGNYKFVNISLFGLPNVAEIEKNIKMNYYLGNGVLSEGAKRFANIKNNISDIFGDGIHGKIAKATLSIDILDIVDVKKCNDNNKTVIVLDDFERSKVNIEELLGLVNNYCENKNIKVIVVANEDEINKNEKKNYEKFKEKVIFRTVKINSDYHLIVSSIVKAYEETIKDYKNFLVKHLDIICLAFDESKTYNLRTLKSCLIDFERIFTLWREIGFLINDDLGGLLYSFSAYKFENSIGKLKKEEIYEFLSLVNEDKYSKIDFVHTINSISNWIESGEWNEAKIINEIKDYFVEKDIPDDQILLRQNFWSLDTKTINNGLPILVKRSYSGELNQNELIALIRLIMQFHKINMKLPCKVDSKKMLKGWNERIKKIENGLVNEPERNRFIDGYSYLKNINDGLYELYIQLENFDNNYGYYKNRPILLKAIDDIDKTKISDMREKSIPCIDKEIAKSFISKYNVSSNGTKNDLVRLLNDLDLDYSDASREQDIKESIVNLNYICKEIKEYSDKHDDEFERCVVNESIKYINNKIKKLQKTLTNNNNQR